MVVGVICFSLFLDIDGQSLRLRGPAINWWLFSFWLYDIFMLCEQANKLESKTLKTNVRNYSNFTITFPTIWRCAGDFFLNIVEIQSGRHGSTSIFLMALKLKKLKAEIIQNENYSIWSRK